MAKFVQNWTRRQQIIDALFKAHRESAASVQLEYDAAVKIQSWFRGTRVRAYLKILDEAAVTIQKNYRGYVGRNVYRTRVKECLEQMRNDYYYAKATCVQRHWRGYYVRKHVHNYYALKEFLEALAVKNKMVVEELREHESCDVANRKAKQQELEKKQFEIEAIQKHYMMSTKSMAGVLKPPHKSQPDPLEVAMSLVKTDIQEMKRIRRMMAAKDIPLLSSGHYCQLSMDSGPVDRSSATTTASTTKDLQRLIALGESCISPALLLGSQQEKTAGYTVLPPIPPKIQGPFKAPEEVVKQRYKPLRPTLRVSTAYDSIETARSDNKQQEWTKRIHDEKLVPFSRQLYPTVPMVNSSLPFEKPAYGTRHFRDANSSKHLAQDFNTNLPPIPLFEQLNSTY